VDISSKAGSPCYGEEDHSFAAVPLIHGVVPPQARAGLDRGIIIIGVALNYHFHYHEGVHVRLYRPGYDLVAFRSWQLGKQVEWKPAVDLAGREKAIDDLLASPGTVGWCQFTRESNGPWDVPGGLRPGSYSTAHLAALRFIAAEYEKLAATNDPPCSAEARQRLLDKAAKVRARMEK
jgi:hypothetical protein